MPAVSDEDEDEDDVVARRGASSRANGDAEGEDGSLFARALAKGLRGDRGAATQRAGGALVGDTVAQARFQEALDQLAQAFLECKRAEKKSTDVLEGAVTNVELAHDKLPAYLKIPAESVFDRLARHARNLAQRAGEQETLTKSLSAGVVLGIEKAVKAFENGTPSVMSASDGMNAITALRALKQTMDRARGTAAKGAAHASEDRAIHCLHLAKALIGITPHDTKVTMHSQYVSRSMMDLDHTANDELTTMSHDSKTTDAEYLWRALRALSDALYQKVSIDSFIERALPSSLTSSSRTSYEARFKVEASLENPLRRAQLIPFLLIEAYASRDLVRVDRIRRLLSEPVDVALSTSLKFLEVHGCVYAVKPTNVRFVQQATEEQIKRLIAEKVPFHHGITFQEARALINGMDQYMKCVPKTKESATLRAESPSVALPSTPSTRERLSPGDGAASSLQSSQTAKVESLTKTQIKSQKDAELPCVRRCELCQNDVRAPNEIMLKNNWKMHLSSKAHKAAIQAKANAKNAKTSVSDPLETFTPEERAYLKMCAPLPPSKASNGVAQATPQLTEVPPPPPQPQVDVQVRATMPALTQDLRLSRCDKAASVIRSPPLGMHNGIGDERVRGESAHEMGEIAQPITSSTGVTVCDIIASHDQHEAIVKRLRQIEAVQKNGKRLRIEEYRDKPPVKRSRGPTYCKHWKRGHCWNGDACRFVHAHEVDSPCDSFSG